MKELKLIKRDRDGVYSIVFYQNNNSKYKSLGTKNKMEAEIAFTKITGSLMILSINNRSYPKT